MKIKTNLVRRCDVVAKIFCTPVNKLKRVKKAFFNGFRKPRGTSQHATREPARNNPTWLRSDESRDYVVLDCNLGPLAPTQSSSDVIIASRFPPISPSGSSQAKENPVIALSGVGSHRDDNPAECPDFEELLYNFETAKMKLADTEKLLDTREYYFIEQRCKRKARLEAGEQVETLSQVDASELQETRRLTRDLIKAEKKYRAAKDALISADMQPPGSDLESGFLDDSDDDPSREHFELTEGDIARVHRWLDNQPGTDDPIYESPETAIESTRREMDEWEAKEVEMCDSWSLVASGADRRRIDKVRAQTVTARACLEAWLFENESLAY